ncbi:hypothetical protein AMTR_s00071p00160140 [Amborella trichopoda]|uniref:Reverse transcriptase RNase H-like domain-containing protein n=1 Tax=Amborella trichopoda TaxID=13333 RepID=U5DCQ6_AMBTC|nr:hypothetical protein AMTR_s00071p00160140 [Amborella trichopoda]
MKLAVPEIEFLGAIIGNRKIRLQPHIIRKILQFEDDSLKTKAGLRSWLGILNYARTYIPKLGTLLGPLYCKTSPHGDKRLKPTDLQLIADIKRKIQNLPDLEIAPEGSYIILETDGCMEGWGGVCKWKPRKADPRTAERVCAYASGKFPILKSTIDAEIHACMETLTALKIYYLDQQEITLRTDCQAIISFFNKSAQNKPSRVRWINFVDYITGTGVNILFEHIDGRQNTLADSLSRLVGHLTYSETSSREEEALWQLEQELSKEKPEQQNLQPYLKILLPEKSSPEKNLFNTTGIYSNKTGKKDFSVTMQGGPTKGKSSSKRFISKPAKPWPISGRPLLSDNTTAKALAQKTTHGGTYSHTHGTLSKKWNSSSPAWTS